MKLRFAPGALVPLFGALMVCAFLGIQLRDNASARPWERVEATVTASGLRSETPQNGPGAGKTVYKPVISYVYEIDGVRHESPLTPVDNQPAPEGVWTQRSAEKAFPRGTKIAVYVDPGNPSLSSLAQPVSPRRPIGLWAAGGICLLLVLFGVFVLFPKLPGRVREGENPFQVPPRNAGSDAGSCAAPPVSGNYASANVRSHKPVLQAGRLLVVPAPAPHLWWTAALMIPAGFALLAATFLTDIPRQRSWESGDYLIACFSVFCLWLGGGIVLSVAILTLKKGMRAAFDRARDRMTVERRTRFTPGEPLDAPLSELQSVLFRRERRVKTIHHRGAQHVAPMVWDSWGVWLRLRNGYDFFLLENGSRRAQEKIARAIADYARVPLETP